ncbi:MAG: tRNA 2-thiouridine(34) synthase MnmA [Candidatus Gastranaerophilales bacterium]|nr:tRNA 2-thiouridine(34) synthase MnmA [Candidatus Gastranaerophilales bacterium]
METVLVGLSGGVDSTVCASLLKEKGYNVIGATMAIWGNREIKGMAVQKGHKDACFKPNEKEDIDEARKISERLGIPYHVLDCADEYNEVVLKHFKSEYLKGRTPNPCIWCNALIKFGALPYMAKKQGVEFDKFATGHYARTGFENGRYVLRQGVDKTKDQSYFLYRLTQEQLKNIILPLGDFSKVQIREIARNLGLEVADKPDSQDFYNGDYNELLEVAPKKGYIKDLDGKILGEHEGIWNYTIGQRKGLGVSSSEPLYVLSLNKDDNSVIVGFRDKTFKKQLTAVNLNFVSFDRIIDEDDIYAKFRSTQVPQKAHVTIENDTMTVVFEEYQKSIAPGQSVVVYKGDMVAAGGIIESAE